ncbi:uncharacterized protein NECHADRAFT_77180 [Fusarium vanettenii 77-13-4]|uniref:J domain-containing protein n=1 Tax=Fusarium vanettenii (strain ATCC MYA-4622 / CBS 123669 / FGSC 9596 / NRRL 45880 / 77-13-4) TaxID=660122 RepID=C7ZJ96_FUSV7|nr:uncharacterized protein NECHADRAFT_77180 [Fusarium vanettenii 77-13-4]EEU35865.1 predicted protein [Fusarium vanettenii 77-13-4]
MDEGADYYRILEIDDSADEANIEQKVKANYKRLARKHHPDKNPGDKNATTRFQKLSQIQHAFDVLSNDIKRKQYNEERPGGKGEAAAREGATESEQQQRNRQRRQQEHQRQQEEEQQQREEEARRQREEERQRDEKRRQDERRQQEEQQRAWERHEAQEEAERQPDPGVRQPEHPKSAAPTPMSRLFESIQSKWTPTLRWWFFGFILVWIAWYLGGNYTPGSPPNAPPLPAPLDEMLRELRIGPSLAEAQVSFTENHNMPYELQLMGHVVGRLIEPLGAPSLVGKYWDYSADAVDGVVEVYMVTNRLVAEVEQKIGAVVSQLEGMIPPQPPFYYRLIGAYTKTSSWRMDKAARQVLIPMAESIYETLDKALMILRTTESNLSMLLGTLDDVVISIDGKSIQDRYHGEEDGYPRDEVVAVRIWEHIFSQLSPVLSYRSATGPAYFYGDASQAKEIILSAEVTMMALQDRLLVFQRALQVAPLTTLENALELCTRALRIDREELRASQSYASCKQKERRRERRLVMSFLDSHRSHRIG